MVVVSPETTPVRSRRGRELPSQPRRATHPAKLSLLIPSSSQGDLFAALPERFNDRMQRQKGKNERNAFQDPGLWSPLHLNIVAH